MPSVYVGTSLLNISLAKEIINKFRSHGVDISYDWTTHGQVFNSDDLYKYGTKEFDGVKSADLFFMICPARTGTHIELGIALAYGKPIVLVLDKDTELKTFYFLQNVSRFSSLEVAFSFALEKLKS